MDFWISKTLLESNITKKKRRFRQYRLCIPGFGGFGGPISVNRSRTKSLVEVPLPKVRSVPRCSTMSERIVEVA